MRKKKKKKWREGHTNIPPFLKSDLDLKKR